jgi:hypothetical protein
VSLFNSHALRTSTVFLNSRGLPAPWSVRLSVLALLCLAGAGSVSAQVNISWNGGYGSSWLTTSNWSLPFVPDNSVNTTYNVTMTNGGVADITNFSIVINNFTSTSGNMLNVTSGSLTLASGGSSLGGSLVLSSSSLYLQSTATATLGATGGISNLSGSSIQLYGALDVTGILNNVGTLVNHLATLTISTNLTNVTGGTLTNNFGATIDNFAIFSNQSGATINNVGTINLFSGLTNNGTLNNFGTINTCLQCVSSILANGSGATVNNGGVFSVAGVFSNAGSFNNSAMDARTGLISSGTFSILNGGSFTNGTPSVIGGGPLPGYFTNPGTLDIQSGGAFTNGAGSTLDSTGQILVAGTFNNDPGGQVMLNPQPLPPGGTQLPAVQINGGGVFNNGGMVSLNPQPLPPGGTGVPAVQINAGGTFNNNPGAMVTLNPQPLPPGGTGVPAVQINAGGVLNNNGTFTMVNSGPNQVPAVQINLGGMMTGNGTINGDVLNGGMLSPGNSPGIMTINGNFTQTSGGAYTAELGGVFLGQYDQLNVSGTASLAGTLNVSLVNSFIVSLGNSFIILNAGSIIGTFGILHLPSIGPGLYWALAYSPTNVTLTAAPVPEPGSLLLFSTGLMACAGLLRRRRRSGASEGSASHRQTGLA